MTRPGNQAPGFWASMAKEFQALENLPYKERAVKFEEVAERAARAYGFSGTHTQCVMFWIRLMDSAKKRKLV